MGRFAKELPAWADKFKTETAIGPADAMYFRNEVGRIGDQYLAETYLGLDMIHRASIYGDFLEREMIERFCEYHAMIPELVLADG